MLPPDPRQLSVNKLAGHVAGLFTPSAIDLPLQAVLDEAGLYPTQKTAYLMAQAAVTVLLAHDIGQNVTGPLKTIEHAAPAQLPPATPPPAAPEGKARHARKPRAAKKTPKPRKPAAPKAAGAGSLETPAPLPPQSPPATSKRLVGCPYCDWTSLQAGRLEPHVKKLHPNEPIPPRP